MAVNKDCFAYKEDRFGSGMCMALKEMYCKNEKCGFYKPKSNQCNGCKTKYELDCARCQDIRHGERMKHWHHY